MSRGRWAVASARSPASEHHPIDHRAVDHVYGQLHVQGLGQLATLHGAGDDVSQRRAKRPYELALGHLVERVVAHGLAEQPRSHPRDGPARNPRHLRLAEGGEVAEQRAGVRRGQLRAHLMES